jgi:organic radical activating enzyme
VALLELAMQTSEAVAHGAAFAVVTGGEPLHHNLNDLCQALRQKTSHATGRPVPLHLETSGVDPLSGEFDWITLSPKRHKPPTPELLAACNELKVVVHNGDDLAFAEQMAVAARASCHRHRSAEPVLLLQPGANCPEGQTLAVGFVRTNPGWRLSLQTHKLLGVR